MRAYIMSVAASCVISAIMNMITPEKWSKYVGVVTGLVLTAFIAQPVIKLMDIDISSDGGYKSAVVKNDAEEILRQEIKNGLEEKLCLDIEKRLKDEFSLSVDADVEVSVNESGEITGVDTVEIFGDRPDAVVKGRIYEVYAPQEVKYVGTEKTFEKSE